MQIQNKKVNQNEEAAVLFLALTGETYATALAFLLLVLKAGLYMKGMLGNAEKFIVKEARR